MTALVNQLRTTTVTRSPLRHLDPASVSGAAAVETRSREVYLPPVTSYRWWARRTAAVNGAILDAIALDRPGRLLVVDPFAGGGVIPLTAVLRGHRTYAQDLNPWAAMGLAGMLDLPNATDLEAARDRLALLAADHLKTAYATTFSDGSPAQISYTFRVATATCPTCSASRRLYPHGLVSLVVRRERGDNRAFLACPAGHLFRGTETGGVQSCPTCERATDPNAAYTARRVHRCAECGAEDRLETLAEGGLGWEVVLVERASGNSRELAFPTEAEIEEAGSDRWQPRFDLGGIPAGQETRVLRRHGFSTWSDLYPARQRAVMEHLLEEVDAAADDLATRRALRLAIYGVAEMAGHLSRWDRYYLKSYEAMAGHRFNFTTFAAEPNVWGTLASGRGSVTRRIGSFVKASAWMHERGIARLDVEGPLAASSTVTAFDFHDVRVVEGSSERMLLEDGVADVVLTDPPYHDDVQYGELSLPLRAWAQLPTDDLVGEASVNQATQQNTAHEEYRALLTSIFQECRRVLAADGHLILSYANRDPRAWEDVLGALNDAGFRAAGYTILHSENETDVVKRDVRACTLDFLMDLVPATGEQRDAHEPGEAPETAEEEFLAEVGTAFLRVGALETDDLVQMRQRLAASRFLRSESPEPPAA